MAIKQKLRNFWKYLNTSHGTHTETSGCASGDGHSFKDIPYYTYNAPDPTPLKKITDAIIVAGAGLILYGGVGWYFYHNYEKSKLEREKIVPHPSYLKLYTDLKQKSFEKIIEYKKLGIPTSYEENNIQRNEYMIEDYKERIKEKIEKGNLTPSHEYWEDYKNYFGNEPWWPKEPNSINLKK